MAARPFRCALGALSLAQLASGLADPLQSQCYIHFQGPFLAGFDDAAGKLCRVANFAAVHNCSVIVAPPAQFLTAQHRGEAYVEENVSWSRYMDLSSNPVLPGSRAIFEEPESRDLLQNATAKGWRSRKYKGPRELKELLKQLHADIRAQERVPRIYSLDLGKVKFWQPLAEAGGMRVSRFLELAALAAARRGLTRRFDLLPNASLLRPGADQRAARFRHQGMSEVELIREPRRYPCGNGPSQEVNDYVATQRATALGTKHFAFLQVRRGALKRGSDNNKQWTKEAYDRCTEPANVARGVLARLREHKGLAPKALLIASNEKQEEWWRELKAALKDKFESVVLADQAFAASPHPSDGYFTYAVAQALADQATLAVRFHPRSMPPEERGKLCPGKD